MFRAEDMYCRGKIYLSGIAAALFLAALALGAAASHPSLPPEESGLAALLEELAIDTFQYEQLLIYYALPLSVPQGELARLVRIFPDIADFVPTPQQLESYRPFDNRQIRRLLNDFPVVADFEPVLRFNETAASPGRNGEIIFGINRSRVSELRGHRARFRQRGKHVSTDGSVALSDSGAIWQGRRIDVSYAGVNAQVGNFRQPVPGELFFGRFSSLTAAERADARTNWLHGGSNTWNGAALDIRKIAGAPAIGAGAFYHSRPGETGAGAGIDWRASLQVRLHAWFTAFDVGGADSVDADADGVYDVDGVGGDAAAGVADGYVYAAHFLGEYRGKTWRTVLETGLPLGQGSVAPALSLRLNYRIRESTAQYRLLMYPEKFNAPLSRVRRQLLTETGERQPPGLEQNPNSPAVQKHSLRMTVPLTIVPALGVTRAIQELEFTESAGAVRRVQGRAELRMRIDKGTNVALRHTSRFFTSAADSALHTSGVSVSVQTVPPLTILASAQSVYGAHRDARSTYSLELRSTALPNTVIAPFVRGVCVRDHDYWLGLKTEIHLYGKTWTGITVELPAGVKGAEGVYIKGSSSYTF
jgi:hypothetical protein